jgi:hypothetical protein
VPPTSVVAARDGAKSLLSSSVPNLQFDCLALQLNCADLKIHSNGANVRLCVGVVRKTQQQARLAHSRVSDQQQLEQIITASSSSEKIEKKRKRKKKKKKKKKQKKKKKKETEQETQERANKQQSRHEKNWCTQRSFFLLFQPAVPTNFFFFFFFFFKKKINSRQRIKAPSDNAFAPRIGALSMRCVSSSQSHKEQKHANTKKRKKKKVGRKIHTIQESSACSLLPATLLSA